MTTPSKLLTTTVAVLATSLGLLLNCAEAANATPSGGHSSDGNTNYYNATTDHGVDLGADQSSGSQQGGSRSNGNSGSNTSGKSASSSWKVTRYVPACEENSPEGGADTLCGAAVNTCQAVGKGYIRMWVYVQTYYSDGRKPSGWQEVGSVCRGPDQPRVQKPQITQDMVIDLARALAPHASFLMEPATTSIVNAPNNFAATTATTAGVTRTPTVLGVTIPVTFTPTGYTWDFGDGTTGTGPGIIHAAIHQPGAVEHAYTLRGTYPVTLTPIYQIRFTLPGGGPITAQINGFTSPPQNLTVKESEAIVTTTS